MKKIKLYSMALIGLTLSGLSNAGTCQATINCNTAGYQIMANAAYTMPSPTGEQYIVECKPSQSGDNNCTFFNAHNECNLSADPRVKIELFKTKFASHMGSSVQPCKK